MTKLATAGRRKISTKPVSYTHLDVYKRQVVDNKVIYGVNYNDEYNNELTSNSCKIVEKGVSKSDTEKINSDDENIELVGGSERVMISIDMVER